VQRSGGKPRRSRRYREAVAGLQGFVRSEIGRLMNLLVAMKKPARLVGSGDAPVDPRPSNPYFKEWVDVAR
jgi:hypothetical protein